MGRDYAAQRLAQRGLSCLKQLNIASSSNGAFQSIFSETRNVSFRSGEYLQFPNFPRYACRWIVCNAHIASLFNKSGFSNKLDFWEFSIYIFQNFLAFLADLSNFTVRPRKGGPPFVPDSKLRHHFWDGREGAGTFSIKRAESKTASV